LKGNKERGQEEMTHGAGKKKEKNDAAGRRKKEKERNWEEES
jgi:hypothetical protein